MIEELFGIMLILSVFMLFVLVCILVGTAIYAEIQDILEKKREKKGEKK